MLILCVVAWAPLPPGTGSVNEQSAQMWGPLNMHSPGVGVPEEKGQWACMKRYENTACLEHKSGASMDLGSSLP